MTDTTVRIENLSKRYRIGGPQARYKTMRETLVDMATAPARRLRRLGRPAPPEETIWALKDVSFEVKHGEVVGIIGRNGAGKTTLLRILSRITEPTEGYVEISGRVGSLLEVGTGFHPELTGRENIYLNGAILGMKRAEIDRKFDEIVAFSEIEKFLDTPVKRYSSGMYVRLAFSVAAHLEPEILLVDEVLAVGDAAFQKKCLGKMGDVASEGRTVLFVSHNMAAIQRLSSNCVLLNDGQVVARGDTRKVMDRYLSDQRGAEARVDIYELSRCGALGSRGRISGLGIFDANMTPTNRLAFGETFTVELTCRAIQPVSDVSFLLGIDSLYEQRIVTITSLEAGKVFSADAQETTTGRLTVSDLLLKPGTYSLTVGLFRPNEGIDRVQNAAHIEVSEISKGHAHVDQVSVGFLQIPNPHWEIVRD
jgi:lipopolysaccharide transport system ATP-binding protein